MLAYQLDTPDEVLLQPEDLIISKTDTRGHITYANRTFMQIAGYEEHELLGNPHNLIRHPDMPRGVFRFLWQELRQGHEFFGFVKNYTSSGQFYWVFANITPDLNSKGEVKGYFSVRRRPSREAVKQVSEIYQKMLEIEQRFSDQEAPDRSLEFLQQLLQGQGVSYERFVMRLQAASK